MGSGDAAIDVEAAAVIPQQQLSAPMASSSDARNSNGSNGSSGSDSDSSGSEGGSSVVVRKDGDESLVLPDGSIECPVDWEGEVKAKEPEKDA